MNAQNKPGIEMEEIAVEDLIKYPILYAALSQFFLVTTFNISAIATITSTVLLIVTGFYLLYFRPRQVQSQEKSKKGGSRK